MEEGPLATESREYFAKCRHDFAFGARRVQPAAPGFANGQRDEDRQENPGNAEDGKGHAPAIGFGHVSAGDRSDQDAGGHSQRVDRKCRSEEHTSELQSLMRISYAVFCLKKKKKTQRQKK